jgi:hypothetical protein
MQVGAVILDGPIRPFSSNARPYLPVSAFYELYTTVLSSEKRSGWVVGFEVTIREMAELQPIFDTQCCLSMF